MVVMSVTGTLEGGLWKTHRQLLHSSCTETQLPQKGLYSPESLALLITEKFIRNDRETHTHTVSCIYHKP